MDTVWFGVKLAFGLVLGFALIFWLFRLIYGFWSSARFSGAGCDWQAGDKPGTPTGWLTRDVRNDDWILWDVKSRTALRCGDEDPPGTPWRVSNETLPQFLTLARQYRDHWKQQLNSN